jgi:hypothetical protein
VVIEASIDELRTMATFVDYVVDSFEKLEVIVHLCNSRSNPENARSIARNLHLGPDAVVDALVSLETAGVVRTEPGRDDAGWWIVPSCTWATTIDLMVQLYEVDHSALLDFIKLVTFDSVMKKLDRRTLALAFLRRKRSGQRTLVS